MVWRVGDDQLWGSGRWTLLGAIAGCHGSVLWMGGGHFFFTLITQKLFFAIWGLCWCNFFLETKNRGIDDVKTKVELLSFCTEHHLPVVSALGSGAKDDCTKICIAQGLREIDNDPLATKLRKISLQGTGSGVMDWSEISFVYSSQKVQRALLPLSEEQRNSPEDFGSVANFRLRVIPVLGTQPAAAGMAIAAQVLNRLGERWWWVLATAYPCSTKEPGRQTTRKLQEKWIEEVRGSQFLARCNTSRGELYGSWSLAGA